MSTMAHKVRALLNVASLLEAAGERIIHVRSGFLESDPPAIQIQHREGGMVPQARYQQSLNLVKNSVAIEGVEVFWYSDAADA